MQNQKEIQKKPFIVSKPKPVIKGSYQYMNQGSTQTIRPAKDPITGKIVIAKMNILAGNNRKKFENNVFSDYFSPPSYSSSPYITMQEVQTVLLLIKYK